MYYHPQREELGYSEKILDQKKTKIQQDRFQILALQVGESLNDSTLPSFLAVTHLSPLALLRSLTAGRLGRCLTALTISISGSPAQFRFHSFMRWPLRVSMQGLSCHRLGLGGSP